MTLVLVMELDMTSLPVPIHTAESWLFGQDIQHGDSMLVII